MPDDATRAGGLVTTCKRCPALVDSRTQVVNGDGPADADLLFVGEAPGADEDEEGRPFVGRSGGVLDEALADVGLDRDTVYITNCVRCRPPDNRDPRTAELDNCRDHLDAEVAHVDPAVIVTLGKVPSEQLLGTELSVTRTAGDLQQVTVGGAARPVVVSVHPAATLYDPGQRETFGRALSRAASLVTGDGQAHLDDF